MDEKKTLDAQEIADEQLDAVAGGVRATARLEVRAAANDDADDEGNDMSSPCAPWVVKCPKCGRSLRNCTCGR